ncbi:MAG: histidine kinase dimerization/phospho-acceptor domain-containing protein [bacterium]
MGQKLGSIFRGSQRKRHLRASLDEFTRALALIVDYEQVLHSILAKIKEMAGVDAICVLLLDPETNLFQAKASRGLDGSLAGRINFSPKGQLAKWLRTNETYLAVSQSRWIDGFLRPEELKIISDFKFELCFPLMAMNQLVGMALLGKKADGQSFASEELDLLTLLTSQSALALENARLFEEQKSRLRKMYRADRLATTGQLAAGAAHEIRNPLTSIRSTIQYLQRGYQKGPEKRMVDELLKEVDRIDGIIDGLLSFARPSEPKLESVELSNLLDQALTLVSTAARKQPTSRPGS